MQIIDEALNGVKLLEPTVFEDHRGYFYEPYNQQTFEKLGIEDNFVQDNQSLSVEAGVLRGLHFQNPPHAQAKLVRVLFGKVLDVAVDIRSGSPTYGEHFAAELSAENRHLMYVPEGFAHGFLVLEPNTLFSYKCSKLYNQPSESGILWNDPDLAINWNVKDPILSEKDKTQINFSEFQSEFSY